MRKLMFLIALAVVASAALGWWRAALATQAGTAPVDDWRVADIFSADPAAAVQRGQQIRATSLFLTTRETELANAKANAGPDVDDTGAPAFPSIAAVSTANNIPYVHLIDGDGNFMRVTSGESLQNGWLIKTVDLRQVIAVFDGEETRFPVAAYLDTAFDAPESDTSENDTSEGQTLETSNAGGDE